LSYVKANAENESVIKEDEDVNGREIGRR